MIVCLCSGSNEREIERAVDAGATSLSEIASACRAGLDCGACHTALIEIVERRCEACPNRFSTCSERPPEPSVSIEAFAR